MKKQARQQYAAATKARRQKQILAVLGVVLVALVAIQGPKTLKMLSGKSTSSSTGTTTTTTSPAATPTTASQPAASIAPATAGAGAIAIPGAPAPAPEVADASPPRLKSQVFSFELFDSKNPFVQQVSAQTTPPVTVPAAGTSTPPPAASTPATGQTSPAPATHAAGAPVSSSYTTQPQAVAAVSAKAGTAVIAVNGQAETVAEGGAFPKANPTFRLVSVEGGVATIGLVGGTYASGSQTVTLVPGHTLTLVDTTDGVRYELRLVSMPAP